MSDLNAAVTNSTVPAYTALDEGHVVRAIVEGIPGLIAQATSYNEVALAMAQKVFKRLYEKTEPPLLVDVHLTILLRIRDVCKSVVKELTNWILYSDNDVPLLLDFVVPILPGLTRTPRSASYTRPSQSASSMVILSRCLTLMPTLPRRWMADATRQPWTSAFT